jgi:maleylpyruvate isomerase
MTEAIPALAWWRDGEQALRATVAAIPDTALDQPSRLPGWTRQTLLAHVTRNADALVNLLAWASTGVPTPMYASPTARDAEITQTAALPATDLRAEFRASQARLAAAMTLLPAAAWRAEVRTAQGRQVPASEVPWMRVREAWVHATDFAGALTFADIPVDVASALAGDIANLWRRRDGIAGLTFEAADTGQRWGDGPQIIRAPLADLLTWMSGRGAGSVIQSDGPAWEPPRWL